MRLKDKLHLSRDVRVGILGEETSLGTDRGARDRACCCVRKEFSKAGVGVEGGTVCGGMNTSGATGKVRALGRGR